MQFKEEFVRRSEEEEVKQHGLTIDFDEIARKGGLTREEKTIAKWYGIYASRQPGNHMARIVIPGGMLASIQARNIAKVAEKYAQGKLSITTRQAIQLHWLKVGDLADMIRDLAKEGNTTMHGCGDVTRTIAACPLAETCQYRRLNVLPYAQKTSKFLGDARDLDDLPRKFKITYSGCSAGCAQPYINCIGAVAVQRKKNGWEEKGFKVIIGGGMGWKAFVGQELFSFVPEDRMVLLTRAIAQTYRDHGDRFNRATSRLKFVVERYGIDKCRALVLEYLHKEGVSSEGFDTEPFQETGPVPPDRPLTVEDPVGTDGYATVRAMVPMGELDYKQFKRMAELSEIYGNQRVYTTNRQNVELKGIDPKRIEEVKAEIRKLGFETEGFYGLSDIVPCVGTTYCPKAVSTTRELYELARAVVRKEKYAGIQKKAVINITGCPNSCSPYRIVDVGFRGMRIREELGSVEGYEMLLGGTQTDFGKKLGEFKKDDCPEVLEKVLDYFLTIRQGEETLTDSVNRLGIERFQEVVFS